VSRYSPREVANVLGTCVETVRRAIRKGTLQANPTGRRGHYWHVTDEQLQAWLLDGGPGPTPTRRVTR